MSVTGPGEDSRLDASLEARDEFQRREDEAAEEAELDADLDAEAVDYAEALLPSAFKATRDEAAIDAWREGRLDDEEHRRARLDGEPD